MTMETPRILLCRLCNVWYTVSRVIPEVCPNCEQSAHWTTAEAMERQPLKLSENDKKFLKSIRISVNNDHEDDCA